MLAKGERRDIASERREDESLQEARARLLRRYAPGTTERQVRWSGGGTQVLELGNGPPLLLIHGGLGQASDWAPIMLQLSNQFHVYAADRPGHGMADPFDYRGVDILLHAVEFLKGILYTLGLKRVPVVGNSMGGRWAIELALQEPDRVSHVILPGLPAGAARELPREFYEVPKLLRLIRQPVIGAFVRNMMAKPSSRERARKGIAGMVSHAERISDEVLDASTFNFIRNRCSMLSLVEQATDKVGMLPELVIGAEKWRAVKVPVAFLWGEKDAFGPPQLGQKAASSVTKGKFVLIPDSGHLPWLDNPSECAGAISEFLSSPV